MPQNIGGTFTSLSSFSVCTGVNAGVSATAVLVFLCRIYLIRRRLELPTGIALVYFAILFSFSVFYPLQLFALHTLFSH